MVSVASAVAGNLTCFFFCVVEWFTLKHVLASLTGWNDAGADAAVWLLACFVVCCEFVGGMTSVATTDALQCAILLSAVFLMPMLGAARWGGFAALGTEFGGADCDNARVSYASEVPSTGRWLYAAVTDLVCSSGGDNEWSDCTPGETYKKMTLGCIGSNVNTSWFYLYPPKYLAVFMWTFAMGCIGFPYHPVALQRIFIGKSDRDVAKVASLVHSYPMVIVLPLLYLGIVVAVVYPHCVMGDDGSGSEGCGAVAMIAKSFVGSGGIFLFAAVLLMASCVAAFLSTADSLIIAMTTSIMVDIVKMVRPVTTAKFMDIGSKGSSIIVMVTSVGLGLYGDFNYIELINYIASYQALLILVFLPIFFPNQIKLVPLMISLMITFIMIPINEGAFQDASADGSVLPKDWVTGPFRSMCWQFGLLIGVSGLFYLYKPLNFLLDDDELHRTYLKWDKVPDDELARFGEREGGRMRDNPVQVIKTAMAQTVEPVTHPIGTLSIILNILIVFFIQPWPNAMFPGLGYREQWEVEEVNHGIPKWAENFIIFEAFCTIILCLQCHLLWREKTPQDNWEEVGYWAWLTGRSGGVTPLVVAEIPKKDGSATQEIEVPKKDGSATEEIRSAEL